jgi:hypothetical protein
MIGIALKVLALWIIFSRTVFTQNIKASQIHCQTREPTSSLAWKEETK